ncbi:CAP domain-containing protein [Aquisphaera insulae]|uniref:CAP domain-containing protein n=1 Tax=Aquisphaera insulae TaxID=2712864 RepID=UPI0013ED3F32|nr:CAP domain-containing protein [Aquisphaera insulae]
MLTTSLLAAVLVLSEGAHVSARAGDFDEPANKPDLDQVAKLLLKETNGFRKEQGKGELKRDDKLTATARDFARFMAEDDKYGHEADGSNPGERVKKHEYEFCVLAENIAYEFNSEGFETEALAKGFVENWKNSPGHRKNMLDPDATEAGMAVAHGEKSGRYYAVQVFARPRSAASSFEVANEAGEAFEYELDGEHFTLEPRYTRTHELCRPGTLKFGWKESVGKAESFEPAKGDRYVVGKKDGKLLAIRKAG